MLQLLKYVEDLKYYRQIWTKNSPIDPPWNFSKVGFQSKMKILKIVLKALLRLKRKYKKWSLTWKTSLM